MDRDFHTDDFERLLREKSDEFRMYPSKRIWHSIYNNIHPGHKWPSVAMCITLISALLLVGYLNTRNSSTYSRVNKIENNNQSADLSQINSTQFGSPTISANIFSYADPLAKNSSGTVTSFKISRSIRNTTPSKSTLNSPLARFQRTLDIPTTLSVTNIVSSDDIITIKPKDKNAIDELFLINIPFAYKGDINTELQKDLKTTPLTYLEEVKLSNQSATTVMETTGLQFVDQAVVMDFNSYPIEAFNNPEASSKATIQIEKVLSKVDKLKHNTNKNVIANTDDKNWVDNYALYNRPAPKKWANKLDWQIYGTPSVVYRTLNNTVAFGSTLNATPFAISSSNQSINSSVIQTPSLGFELGTGLKYLILKNVRIKGGIQFAFTRYNAHAFGNSHPVATKLTMHNFETKTSYEVYRSTAYSNNSGLESVKLHNETFQISLPVGMDLKLIGNERLQWNIGATIQPTFVAGGKSYLISSDRHNYVKETSMLNRWNLNAGFETFVSFRSNGLTWQVGPQLRKQLFSTNSKTFAVEEKLVNYGLKFGVSKTLK